MAWAANQMEHNAGTTTQVSLQWLPDGPGAAVQCVFGDRIVKGHLFTADSGDTNGQKVGATFAQLAHPPHSLCN